MSELERFWVVLFARKLAARLCERVGHPGSTRAAGQAVRIELASRVLPFGRMAHMELVPIADTPLPNIIEAGQIGGALPCLDIELDAHVGSLRIYDPRLFHVR